MCPRAFRGSCVRLCDSLYARSELILRVCVHPWPALPRGCAKREAADPPPHLFPPTPRSSGRASPAPKLFHPLLLRPGLATTPVITEAGEGGRDAAASPALTPAGEEPGLEGGLGRVPPRVGLRLLEARLVSIRRA